MSTATLPNPLADPAVLAAVADLEQRANINDRRQHTIADLAAEREQYAADSAELDADIATAKQQVATAQADLDRAKAALQAAETAKAMRTAQHEQRATSAERFLQATCSDQRIAAFAQQVAAELQSMATTRRPPAWTGKLFCEITGRSETVTVSTSRRFAQRQAALLAAQGELHRLRCLPASEVDQAIADLWRTIPTVDQFDPSHFDDVALATKIIPR